MSEEFQPGDILLIEGTSPFDRLIQWATVSPYSHVALVGYGVLYEALDTQGVVMSPKDKYAKACMFHGRVPSATPEQIAQIMRWVTGWVGHHYGWREALTDGVRDVLHVPVRPKVWGHLDCSGLIAAAYAEGGCPLTRAIAPAPGDIWASMLVEEVK
ncbi:MAG TPA: hypothetical protein VMV23_00330 [Candidatus Nanopelagicaceae bacterium]|nr:hypothetical protein [Candidatus Nanopelagicaceae bacterium]